MKRILAFLWLAAFAVLPQVVVAEESSGGFRMTADEYAAVMEFFKNRLEQNRAQQEKAATVDHQAPASSLEKDPVVSQIHPEAKDDFKMVETQLPPSGDIDAEDDSSLIHNEFNIWAGIWRNMESGAFGIWGQGEYFVKFESFRDQPESFGLGAIAKFDYGELDSYDWGYFALGPDASYWREISLTEAVQLKLRLPYRMDFGERKDGLMPGLYAEYAKNLGIKDTLIISGEVWYFEDDSYLGFQAVLEHWINSDLKLRAGGIAYWNFFADGSHFGWGPTLGVKIWDKLTIGGSLSFVSGGTIVGGIIGYDYNSWVAAAMEKSRQQNVEKKEEGKSEPAKVGQVALVETKSGDYSTLPGENQEVVITDSLLSEKITENKK